MLLRNSWLEMLLMLTPPIKMSPKTNGWNPIINLINVDLPLPICPTNATFSPLLIVRFIFSNTKSSLYLWYTPFTTMSPFLNVFVIFLWLILKSLILLKNFSASLIWLWTREILYAHLSELSNIPIIEKVIILLVNLFWKLNLL